MQLSLFKALFIIGTLVGMSMADYGHEYKHHKGGVIKRTILIDGCTGKPVEDSYKRGGDEVIVEDENPPPIDIAVDPPVYPTYDVLDDDIFSIAQGYPAQDELVDDYDYLGGGDITDDELII